MNFDLYHDPWKNHPYYLTDGNSVDWKGNIGVGDILFGLNAVHMLTHLARKKRPLEQMIMNVYWEHKEDHLHHFEDPETIIERCDYLHSFYHDVDAVKVNHIFEHRDEELWKIRHRGFQRVAGPTAVLDGIPSWMFRQDSWCDKPIDNKVVFWRPFSNAETAASWKRTFTEKDWERIIDTLKDKGFEPIELTYRTPVREVFYHIKHCRFAIFYDGMWQYVARNFMKPVISLGNASITQTHSPQGIFFQRGDDPKNCLWDYLDKLPDNLNHMDRRLNQYKNVILDELNV